MPAPAPNGEIFNPRTGQRMIFLGPDDPALLRIESFNPPSNKPEPEHVHPFQESRATVISGRLTFRVNGQQREIGPGETVVIPAATPHTFWNAGPEEAHSLQEFRPALNGRDFFESYFHLAAAGKVDEDGRPSLMQMAVLLPAYSRFLRPTRPPWPLLAALTAVLAPLARALGYRASFAPDSASRLSQPA